MPLDTFTTGTGNRDKETDPCRNKSKQPGPTAPSSEVTLEDLKRARLIAARLVDRYGDT